MWRGSMTNVRRTKAKMWRKIVRTKPGTFNEQFCSFSCKEHEWKHKVKVLVISMVISIVRKPLLIGRPLPTKQFLLTENDDERCPPERQHLQLPILNTMTTSHFLAYPGQYTDVTSTELSNLCMISASQWHARWWGHHRNCSFSFHNCSSVSFYFTDVDGIVYTFLCHCVSEKSPTWTQHVTFLTLMFPFFCWT